MINPAKVALFIPPGLAKFKAELFNNIGKHIQVLGGRVVRDNFNDLDRLPADVIPIVGCTPDLRPLIDKWVKAKRQWIYWDRGYCDRVFATCLPTGDNMGYYRWHVGSFQLQVVRDVPDDRWRKLKGSREVRPWAKGGRHIVIAAPTNTYCRFHLCQNWIARTIDALAKVTDRQFVIRDKEQYKRRPIQMDLEGAHCLVTHGSNAAVESAILGCPVFVHPTSAAALVGLTDITKIEAPIYPEREKWFHNLAHSQYTERELLNGVLWKLLS